MDGTLAKFYRPNCMDEFKNDGFFENLEPVLNLCKALEILQKKSEISILSAVVDNKAIKGKLIWLNKYCPTVAFANYFFPIIGMDSIKSEYVEKKLGRKLNASDILIDDYSKNLVEWENSGGTGIKFYNGVNMRGWNGYNYAGCIIEYNDSPVILAKKIHDIEMMKIHEVER